MSDLLDTKKVNGGQVDLIAYGAGWEPWTHCIRYSIDDGKAYARPGLFTCTGWVNFESLETALKRFREIQN